MEIRYEGGLAEKKQTKIILVGWGERERGRGRESGKEAGGTKTFPGVEM